MTKVYNYRDKNSMVQYVLDSGLNHADRRVMCACVGLANDEGFLKVNPRLIAPMSGVRLPYVREALNRLTKNQWITPVSDVWKITVPLEYDGPGPVFDDPFSE